MTTTGDPHWRWLPRLALLAIVAATIGCDQLSKRLATTHLAGGPRRSFLGDTLRLEYACNQGAFLSLGAEWPAWVRSALFTAGTGALLAAVAVAAARGRWPRRPRLGLTLIFAGGASNLIDRVAHASVVDFLNLGVGPLRTGIFNVADVAIVLGAALLWSAHTWPSASASASASAPAAAPMAAAPRSDPERR